MKPTSIQRCAMKIMVFPALVFWTCCAAMASDASTTDRQAGKERMMQVQYLEIVTPDVEATCEALSALHGVAFGEPEPALGNARVTRLSGGGRIGVRAPLRSDEAPVVRPYLLVENISAAIEAAEAAGAEFAMTATQIPGHGTFAIYFLGGIQHGLWELQATESR